MSESREDSSIVETIDKNDFCVIIRPNDDDDTKFSVLAKPPDNMKDGIPEWMVSAICIFSYLNDTDNITRIHKWFNEHYDKKTKDNF